MFTMTKTTKTSYILLCSVRIFIGSDLLNLIKSTIFFGGPLYPSHHNDPLFYSHEFFCLLWFSHWLSLIESNPAVVCIRNNRINTASKHHLQYIYTYIYIYGTILLIKQPDMAFSLVYLSCVTLENSKYSQIGSLCDRLVLLSNGTNERTDNNILGPDFARRCPFFTHPLLLCSFCFWWRDDAQWLPILGRRNLFRWLNIYVLLGFCVMLLRMPNNTSG